MTRADVHVVRAGVSVHGVVGVFALGHDLRGGHCRCNCDAFTRFDMACMSFDSSNSSFIRFGMFAG